jgi:tRNA-specific 2-thiouridylase
MVQGYRTGATPNPDVECNRTIKFGLFFDRAIREGADMVATGHYARIVSHDGRRYLTAAADAAKDQTYFLWAIPPETLSRTVFPVGDLTKPTVRTLARRAGLPTADKRDSQGVCFVGDLNVKDFLAARIRSRRGSIVHVDGRLLGTHDGAAYYTIGQRHGLDIRDGGGPYFVVRKDMRRNRIIVGPERALYSDRARLTAPHWFGPRPGPRTAVRVKIRYRTPAVKASLGPGGRIRFSRPVRAIAPGQSAVLYRGRRLIGGGILA